MCAVSFVSPAQSTSQEQTLYAQAAKSHSLYCGEVHSSPAVSSTTRMLNFCFGHRSCPHAVVLWFRQVHGIEKIVYVRNCSICTFPSLNAFINEKVYLAWNCLTANAKECTSSWSLEINGTRLVWICGKVQLLRIVVGIVSCPIK